SWDDILSLFSQKRAPACHPERSARNARVAKDLLLGGEHEGGTESRSFAPAALRMTGSLVPLRRRERRTSSDRGSRHSPNGTRLVSCSRPVGRVSDSYSSGRRAATSACRMM